MTDVKSLDLHKYDDLNDFAACVIECHSINCRRTRAIRELTAEVVRLRHEVADLTMDLREAVQ